MRSLHRARPHPRLSLRDTPLPELNVGLNVSIAGKIYLAVDRALERECTCMQIFSRSPRRFRAPPLLDTDAAKFRRRRREAKLAPLVVHIPYLINIASPDDAFWAECLDAYVEDLRRADALRAEYFVTHLGSPKGEGVDFGLGRVAEAFGRILETYRPRCRILLENTAGGTIGRHWEHLGHIMEATRGGDALGVCLDTAHALASGYDVAHAKGLDEMLGTMDDLFGLDRLCLVHANDTKAELGSGLDRHEHIGRGAIGRAGFRTILSEKRLWHLPFVLETPTTGAEDDLANIRTLRRLAREANRAKRGR